MIPARIVGCSRLPSRPQNTGASAAAPRSSRIRASSRASDGASWLPARLAALAAADEQRRQRPLELEVGPVERDQLRSAQTGLDEREQDDAVALCQACAPPRRVLRSSEEPCELLLGQPVRLLLWLRRRLELEEWVGRSASPAEPAQEPTHEAEASVVGGRSRIGAPLVVRQMVDDRRLLEDAEVAIAAPREQVVDRDPVGGDRALASLGRLEPAQPVVACAPQVRWRGCGQRRLPQLAKKTREEGYRVGGVRGCRCPLCRRGHGQRRSGVLADRTGRIVGVELEERELPGRGVHRWRVTYQARGMESTRRLESAAR